MHVSTVIPQPRVPKTVHGQPGNRCASNRCRGPIDCPIDPMIPNNRYTTSEMRVQWFGIRAPILLNLEINTSEPEPRGRPFRTKASTHQSQGSIVSQIDRRIDMAIDRSPAEVFVPDLGSEVRGLRAQVSDKRASGSAGPRPRTPGPTSQTSMPGSRTSWSTSRTSNSRSHVGRGAEIRNLCPEDVPRARGGGEGRGGVNLDVRSASHGF